MVNKLFLKEATLSNNTLVELIPEVLKKGASFRFRVDGSSMYPSIRSGDVITVSPLNGEHPRRNDVIAFKHPVSLKLVVHRFIRCRKKLYLLKGDHLLESDGWVPRENLLGVVTLLERAGEMVNWPQKNLFLTRTYLFLIRIYQVIKKLLKQLRQLLKGVLVNLR